MGDNNFKGEGDTGEVDDRVRLQLGPDDIHIFEEYNVHCAILQQPSIFSTRFSAAKGTAALLDAYRPGPTGRFALSIGEFRQFTGELDAVEASGGSGSTSVTFKGRDLMARLHDGDVQSERSFDNATHEELVKAALEAVGLGQKILEASNTAHLRIKSGVKVKVVKEVVKVDEIRQSAAAGNKTKVVVTAKLGESWLDFLKRHLDKHGLFLWSDPYGNFVLSRPNPNQEPTYKFFRERWGKSGVTNVTDCKFTNDTTHRFSEIVIFARAGGKKFGRNHTKGNFIDGEMCALGFNRQKVYRDANVLDAEEAEFYAQLKIAEANRASWKLEYTVSGHSTTTMAGPRAVIVPDTVARVDDYELGIHRNLYIESVNYTSPPRKTVITLMRPEDLVFGTEERVRKQKSAQFKKRKMLSFTREQGSQISKDEIDILNGIRRGALDIREETAAINKGKPGPPKKG